MSRQEYLGQVASPEDSKAKIKRIKERIADLEARKKNSKKRKGFAGSYQGVAKNIDAQLEKARKELAKEEAKLKQASTQKGDAKDEESVRNEDNFMKRFGKQQDKDKKKAKTAYHGDADKSGGVGNRELAEPAYATKQSTPPSKKYYDSQKDVMPKTGYTTSKYAGGMGKRRGATDAIRKKQDDYLHRRSVKRQMAKRKKK